jgi:hypothetical protein
VLARRARDTGTPAPEALEGLDARLVACDRPLPALDAYDQLLDRRER